MQAKLIIEKISNWNTCWVRRSAPEVKHRLVGPPSWGEFFRMFFYVRIGDVKRITELSNGFRDNSEEEVR